MLFSESFCVYIFMVVFQRKKVSDVVYLILSAFELVQYRLGFRAYVQFCRVVHQEYHVGPVDEPLTYIVKWEYTVYVFSHFQYSRDLYDVHLQEWVHNIARNLDWFKIVLAIIDHWISILTFYQILFGRSTMFLPSRVKDEAIWVHGVCPIDLVRISEDLKTSSRRPIAYHLKSLLGCCTS